MYIVNRYSILLPTDALLELGVINLYKLFYMSKKKNKAEKTICITQLVVLLEEKIKSD